MAIRTPRELAIRLKANAIDCEIIAGKDLPSAQRARLLKMAEHYWQMADRIDQPRVRPGR